MALTQYIIVFLSQMFFAGSSHGIVLRFKAIKLSHEYPTKFFPNIQVNYSYVNEVINGSTQ